MSLVSVNICASDWIVTHAYINVGVGRYVGFTPTWERTICGIRAGELDIINPVHGIGNTHTRLHFYG